MNTGTGKDDSCASIVVRTTAPIRRLAVGSIRKAERFDLPGQRAKGEEL